MTDADLLRKRIEACYRSHTGSESGHGALTWFAEIAHVQRETVSRWVTGEREPVGPAIGLLECLEREAGIQ